AAVVLGHPALVREQAVELLSPDGAPAAFRDFLALLADNRRLGMLPEIAGLYEDLRDEAEQVVKAMVTSATAMPASELDTIETAVDEGLIGGAVIAAGDVVIDGSLRGKLARLQSALAQ